MDLNKRSFIGNTIRIPARWENEYEDRWFFNLKEYPASNEFYIRLNNHHYENDPNILLTF
jgi:hypothetical protein